MNTLSNTQRSLLVAGLLIAAAQSGAQAAPRAHDNTFPDKPLHLILPFPAGGTPDQIARIVSDQVGKELGQRIIIDNRPGASGIIAYGLAAKAAPDGYTLVHATPSIALDTIVYKKLPYNLEKDLEPVTNIAQGFGYLLVANPSVPAKSLKELIALSKTRQLHYGSPGVGDTLQLATALLDQRAHMNMLDVPYKGVAPALAALLGGDVQVMIIQPPAGVPQIKAGKLRAIAFTGAKRWSQMPDLPTVSESGLPGFVVHFTWNGWFAPAKTPQRIVMLLQRDVHKALQVPKVHDFLVTSGWEPLGSTPQEFRTYVAAQLEVYAKAAKLAHIEPR